MPAENTYTHRDDIAESNRSYLIAQLEYQDRLLNGEKYDVHRDDDRYSAPFDEALNSHSATYAEADPHQSGYEATYGHKDSNHERPYQAYSNLTISHQASHPRRVERFEPYDPASDSAFPTQQLYQSSRDPLAILAELESDQQTYHSHHPNSRALAQFNRPAPHKVLDQMHSRPQAVSHPVPGLTEPLPIDQEVRGIGVTKHDSAVGISRLIELKRRAKALEELKNRSFLDQIPHPPQEQAWYPPEIHHSSIPVYSARDLSALSHPDIIPAQRPPLGAYTIPHFRQPTEHLLQQPDYYNRTQPPLIRPRTLSQPLLPPNISDPSLHLHRFKPDRRFTDIMSPGDGFDLFNCVSLYYGRFSEVYNKAGEIELRQILDRPLDAVLASDPFAQPIPIDYGYGLMKSLNDYGVVKEQLDCIDAICLDDLYLLEQVLRNDLSIVESERLRRWNRRMRWEEMSIQQQQVQWDVMSSTDRRNLGLAAGGWWAYRLRMIPLDDTYGHHRKLVGADGLFEERHSGFKKGTFEAHYPLSTQTKVKFPFWRDGGLGLGRSLIKWLELPSTEELTYEATSPLSSSSAVVNNPSIQAVVVEPQNEDDLQRQKDDQLMSRLRDASRRRAHLIASIQSQTLVPPTAAELAYAASYPAVNHAHFDHRGHHYGYPGSAAYSPHYHHPVHHHPGQYHAPVRQPVHRNHSVRSKDVKPITNSIPNSSSNRSASGLPWGALLAELRKRPGWGGRHPSNSKPKPSEETKGDSLKDKSDDPFKATKDSTTKYPDLKDSNMKKKEEKREEYKRMESSSSVNSQVPAPPAYQSNGLTRKPSFKGLPQPPMLYKAKEFPRSGSSGLMKERPKLTQDT
ncbi:hypothetical protein DFH28DRAFT_960825 [Melampsora americana]|nr:hypothetical protein DFH28DRAFT_960825 [Melampsora americana]